MVGQRPQPFGIGVETGQHADGENRAQQRRRGRGNIGRRIERAVGDGLHQALGKKPLDLPEPGAYERARLRRHRRTVERRVDQQAAAMVRIGERHRDQLIEKVADRAEWIAGGGKAGETFDQPLVRVAAQRLDEQAVLVGEAVIERGRTQPRRLRHIA